MTRQFECEPFRDKDENGVLQASGVRWTETASMVGGFNRVIIIGCDVVLVVLFAFSLMLGPAGIIVIGVIGVVLFAGLRAAFGPLPQRAVIFHRDGVVETPHGLPREKRVSRLRFRQAEINSIEIIGAISGLAQDWTKSVALITEDGHTIPVGTKLHSEEAREVAVALSMALRDMRAAVRVPQVPTQAATRPVRRAEIR
jgi:hypothetical protein